MNFLKFLSKEFWNTNKNSRIFGVTVKDGAYTIYRDASGKIIGPQKTTSVFMGGNVKDLVGAGDSFRGGLCAYIAKNIDEFKNGKIKIDNAVQMGNLFASIYIQSPLNDRYSKIEKYEKMIKLIER